MLYDAIEPATALRLVLGVARLGEADLQGWWSSQGMNPAVGYALAGFRRTSKVLGAELAVLSATRRHLQILPRVTAVHLFSPYLPFAGWTRAYLSEQKALRACPIIDELQSWTTIETAQIGLRAWRGAVDVPVHRGESVHADELQEPEITAGLLVRFVDNYIAQQGDLAIPYVDFVR